MKYALVFILVIVSSFCLSAQESAIIVSPTGNVGINTTNPTTELEVAGTITADNIVPVGAIIAWYKLSDVTLTLPANFVECDGALISDPESPFNGKTAPDLNGEGRFLRGANIAGAMQDDAFQKHTHKLNRGPWTTNERTSGSNFWGPTGGPYVTVTDVGTRIHEPVSYGGGGTPRVATETRPINMSVVWIMRIK